jgi:hypothetical protein
VTQMAKTMGHSVTGLIDLHGEKLTEVCFNPHNHAYYVV